MKYYIIYNEDKKAYFESDFAGWSWFDGVRLAHKFKSEQDAMDCIKWTESSDTCSIQEVYK